MVELVGGGSVPAVCVAGLFKHNFEQKQHPLKVWIEFLMILNFGDPLPLVIECQQRNHIIFKFSFYLVTIAPVVGQSYIKRELALCSVDWD